MSKITAVVIAALILVATIGVVGAVSTSDKQTVSASFYENKYVATKATPPAAFGTLKITINAQTTIFSNTAIITRVAEGNQFTSGVPVGKAVADKFKPLAKPEKVNLIGLGAVTTVNLPAGIYTVQLPDGNAGFPEYAIVRIANGFDSGVNFQGHATVVPVQSDNGFPITIKGATYGAVSNNCVTITVVDSPAIPGHSATAATGQRVNSNTPGHVHAAFLGNGHAQIDFYYNGIPMHITGNSHDDAFIVTPGTSATPYIPAVTHQETICTSVGQFVDVTAKLQSVIDSGVFQVVFNNAQNPGGIFDTTNTLRSQITDPVPNVVKKVTVDYSDQRGVSKTVQFSEYSTMDFVTGTVTGP